MAMLRHPTGYFATDRGRTMVYRMTVAATMIASGARMLPETFLIDYYVDVVHSYQNGYKKEVTEKIQNRFNDCMDVVKATKIERITLKPFTVCGFDIFHAGSLKSKWGALVGIPTNYTYESVNDIDKENTIVDLKKVNWESKMGKQLQEAIILSDQVQKFAICREILSMRSWKIYMEGLYPAAAIMFTYALTVTLNDRLALFTGPAAVRYLLYTLTILFGLGLYFFAEDVSAVSHEYKIDKQLVALGPEFIESGIEFYDKIQKRNIALRFLMGKEGAAKYSALGNENFFIRQKRIPINKRKQFFMDKLEEYKKKAEAEAVTSN